MKKRGRYLVILLGIFLISLTLYQLSFTSSHPLTDKHQVFILEEDTGDTIKDVDKKLVVVPGLFIEDIDILLFILLLLANCAAFISTFRLRFFIGPIFNQSNYVIHFFGFY